MRRKKQVNVSKYLPVFIILLSLTIILGSTFAYFTDKIESDSSLNFSKVELSDESNVGINGTIMDVMPGQVLVDTPITFSKSIDSEDIYVRAKLSFSIPDEWKEDVLMQQYLDGIRRSNMFDIETQVQNGAVWSKKQGNYFYLLDNGNVNNLKRVDDIFTYKLSDAIVVPRDLEALEDNYQYMKSINFHIAIQAVQASSVSGLLSDATELFNSVFPESEDEKLVTHTITYMANDKLGVSTTLTYSEGDRINELLSPEIDDGSNADVMQVFEGWYTDYACTTRFEVGNIIEESYVLYPKIISVTNPKYFKFNGSVLTSYVGEMEEVYIPNSYSIASVDTQTSSFQSLWQIDEAIMYDAITLPITLTDTESNSITLEDRNDFYNYMGELESMSYPLSYQIQVPTYTYGNDFMVTELGEGAFSENNPNQREVQITSVSIPYGITKIGKEAFEYCYKLTSIELPDSVTTIGHSAFMCSEISSIDLGNSVTKIESYAFYGCGKLTSIHFPKALSQIGDKVFNICDNLTEITIDAGNEKYYCENNCLIERETKTLVYGCYNSTIPNDIKIIGEDAFANRRTLTKMVIPEGVEEIGSSAFYCTNLMSVEFPSTLKKIGSNAFLSTKVQELVFGENIETIGSHAFRTCKNLKKVTFLNNNLSIIDLFMGSSVLDTIVIKGGTLVVNENDAFTSSISITTLYLDNASICETLVDASSSGGLLTNATTIYLNKEITTIGSYIIGNYTKDETNLYNENGEVDVNGIYFKYAM